MPSQPEEPMRMLIEHQVLHDHWYVVAEGADVADAPVAVRLLGRDLVLWRSASGCVVAAPDRCPHREAPLSTGSVHDGCLVCPYHGWTFADEGRCVEVPSSGAGRPVPPTAHLPTVRVDERYGLVWLCLGEPVAEIPRMAAEDDPAYRRINSGVAVWSTSATRMTDNFLDISHFPYVHVGTLGVQHNQDVPKIELEQLDDDFFGYEYEVDVDNELGATASGISAKVVTRRMTTGFNLPVTVRSTIHYATGLDHLILLCSTPIDDARSYFTFVIWRNDDFSVPGEEIIAFDRAIGAEDKAMLERVPGVLPMEQSATVSVQADKASVEWRRRLAELLGS
jgi:phenylpropionate dioxygenase-like ring-hydroxylating dioxygenase large terminal subunit